MAYSQTHVWSKWCCIKYVKIKATKPVKGWLKRLHKLLFEAKTEITIAIRLDYFYTTQDDHDASVGGVKSYRSIS